MPNLDRLAKLLWDPLPKHCLFPSESIIIPDPHPAKLVYDTSRPSPRPPRLDIIPKFVIHRFASIRVTKYALLRNGCQSDAGPPFMDFDRIMPNWPHKRGFSTNPKWVPNLWPIELVITKKVTLSLISRACETRVTISNKFSTFLSSVVEKSPVVLPPSSIRVPPERGLFAVKKDDIFLSPFLLWPPISMNDFYHVEKSLRFSKWPFSSPNISEVGAHRVALNWGREGNVISLKTNRCKVIVASKNQCRILLSISVET